MQIGLDISPMLQKTKYGVPYYVESLVRTLIAKSNGFSYSLTTSVCPSEVDKLFREMDMPISQSAQIVTYERMRTIPVQGINESFQRFLWRSVAQRLRRKLETLVNLPPRHREHIDVFHHTDYMAGDWSRLRCRHVATIHDMIPVKFPEMCSDAWLFFAQKAFRFVKSRADSIITYSESSRRDIAEHLKFPSDRIHVIPLAVRPSLFQGLKQGEATTILNRYKIERGNYILAVGRLDPMKNIPRLIEAFRAVIAEPGTQGLQLVLTGPLSNGAREDGKAQIQATLERFGVENRCVLTGFVDDVQLSALMTNCLCFVQPSFYEGFGLPVLEAMALGAPVVASNTSSVPEITGDAAILIDPRRYDEIAQAIISIRNDSSLAEKLRHEGKQQSREFSWENVARAHEHVYSLGLS